MPREVVIDFTGAPPAQGGTGSDRVPAGQYLIEIKEVTVGTAKSSGATLYKAEFKVVRGVTGNEFEGKILRDNFVAPKDETSSKFGMQRFNAMLVAVGINVGEKRVKLDLDTLAGKRILADVIDEDMPAQGDYAARTISKIHSYFNVAAMAAAKKAANGTVQAPAAAPAPAPVVEAPAVAAEPEAATVVSAVAEEATPVAASGELTGDLDDLFA